MYISPEIIEAWPLPNYTNPIERGPWVIVITIILYVLVLGVVGLRTFTRVFISRSFGADDITILIAMVHIVLSPMSLLIFVPDPNSSLRGCYSRC
jgi:hypothetical protein